MGVRDGPRYPGHIPPPSFARPVGPSCAALPTRGRVDAVARRTRLRDWGKPAKLGHRLG